MNNNRINNVINDEIREEIVEELQIGRTASALGSRESIDILRLLADNEPDELSRSYISDNTGISPNRISGYLDSMTRAGIIKQCYLGSESMISLNPECRGIRQLAEILDRLLEIGGSKRNKSANIMVTLNSGYLHQLCVMLTSLVQSNPDMLIRLYVVHSSLSEEELAQAGAVLGDHGTVHSVRIDKNDFSDAPTTDRYPSEMYYRIFAAKYLPESLDRILYLDPDLVVNGSISGLYETPFDGALFAAASHVGNFMTLINSVRLNASNERTPYINSGVMLMNLKALRERQDRDKVFRYIEENRNRLILPDQDIISALYGPDIKLIDSYRYNMTERLFALHIEAKTWLDVDWVRKHSVIIHYCGRNKPWKPGYIGKLGIFYDNAEAELRRRLSRQ